MLGGNVGSGANLPAIPVAALAGAYMWVLYDLIGRTRRRDLAPADLSWGSFRFVVAAPLGLSVAALFTEEAGVAVAFLLGAFPTRTLITLMQRAAASKVGLEGYADESGHEILKLQGISRVSAERFGDEGVSTILQLAYSDPVDLTMRTNFAFSYVIDCCSQALAWIYFEDKMPQLRQYGVRGAMEIGNVLKGVEKKDKQSIATLNEVAAKLDMRTAALMHSFKEIADDPYTKFLADVWMEIGSWEGLPSRC